MKLQNMTVIFIIIMIPIFIVTSYYIQLQIDTISMQTSYTSKLIQSTKQAIEAYEINSVQWNNQYSQNTDSERRNINAAINTFISNFANALGIGGTSKEYMANYIPAVLFTMYDGYYIYSLAEDETGNYTHMLQPFIPYTELLTSGSDWVVINYSLDNYIEVYGQIGTEYITKKGYLMGNIEGIYEEEELSENLAIEDGTNLPKVENYNFVYSTNKVKIYYDSTFSGNKWFIYRNGEKIYLDQLTDEYKIKNADGIEYTLNPSYTDTKDYSAFNFKEEIEKTGNITEWFNHEIADNANKTWTSSVVSTTVTFDDIDSDNNPDPASDKYKESTFTQHKLEVIQESIENSLNKAMYSSSLRSSVSYDFRLPQLKATDWDYLLSNVSIIAFAQGLPIGNKYFNNYAIATSTNNNEYVDPNQIYFTSSSDDYYHRYNCSSMLDDVSGYVGYKSTDYVIRNYNYKDLLGDEKTKYYYLHDKLACYDCLVNRQSYEKKSGDDTDIKRKYYTALYRERYISHEFE